VRRYYARQQTVTVTVTVRRDTTPPQVTGISAAAPLTPAGGTTTPSG
jgi:hypothetical protein